MSASFIDNEVKSQLKGKRKLSAYLDAMVRKACKKTSSLHYIFVSDDFLLALNQQYLQHDTLTDIITFDLSNSSVHIDGEIYISVDRVRENAAKFEVPYHDELLRVIFHGALHLCGYKDKSKADKAAMRAAEDKCLKEYAKIK
jgi:probable rRNA maturation factor